MEKHMEKEINEIHLPASSLHGLLGTFLEGSFLVILFLLIHCGILILLIFGNLVLDEILKTYKIVHVALCLGEFHLIHSLASIPMLMSEL